MPLVYYKLSYPPPLAIYVGFHDYVLELLCQPSGCWSLVAIDADRPGYYTLYTGGTDRAAVEAECAHGFPIEEGAGEEWLLAEAVKSGDAERTTNPTEQGETNWQVTDE